MVTMREQLDELARLQEAAKTEQTTIAICAYRRALLRDGDSLLEYVRELEGELEREREEALWAANPNADKARVWLASRDAYLRSEGAAQAFDEMRRQAEEVGQQSGLAKKMCKIFADECIEQAAKRLREGGE